MTNVILINEKGECQRLAIDTSMENSQVSTILEGKVRFLGKLNADDVVVIKENCKDPTNPYRFDGLSPFRGKALIVRTDDDGNPVDIFT